MNGEDDGRHTTSIVGGINNSNSNRNATAQCSHIFFSCRDVCPLPLPTCLDSIGSYGSTDETSARKKETEKKVMTKATSLHHLLCNLFFFYHVDIGENKKSGGARWRGRDCFLEVYLKLLTNKQAFCNTFVFHTCPHIQMGAISLVLFLLCCRMALNCHLVAEKISFRELGMQPCFSLHTSSLFPPPSISYPLLTYLHLFIRFLF
ncbi:MAG: hypothetical protein J3R72DRAFT_197094 [Linnemannia gamsii]|nr:MAG: hypothetical protein J3R72DRAFT_197094 [Linnemannia gamsii]